MKTYIGAKIVKAEPQEEHLSGRDAEIDAHGHSRAGYKVVYEDGYVSWSPKDVFERCYRELINIVFLFAFCLISSVAFAASGTATLSWQDNSGIVSPTNCSDTAKTCDAEENFNIYRNLNGGPFAVIATTGPNINAATDTTPVIPFAPAPPNVYCYRITAFNHATPLDVVIQESAPSNQACKTFQPIALVVPPAASNLTIK